MRSNSQISVLPGVPLQIAGSTPVRQVERSERGVATESTTELATSLLTRRATDEEVKNICVGPTLCCPNL